MSLIKSVSDLEKMYRAGQLAAAALKYTAQFIKPGCSTNFLNQKAHEFIIERGAYPSPLNYRGFPKSICTSRNEVICHGIPSDTDILQEGDICNIDITVTLEGFFGDTSKTYVVGSKTTPDRQHVMEVSHESLALGITQAKPDNRVGDIGAAIQSYAEKQGCSVVRAFVGHGIGRAFHEDPMIPHYGFPNRGVKLRRGMCFTIEPMINAGTYQHYLLEDGWTAVTQDGKDSAQFEHTLALIGQGCVVLTAHEDDTIYKRALELGAPIVESIQEKIFRIGEEWK